ncbi:disease resistance protein RML1A-like [Senna tora]|uniref:Disease resistance protein RML1A-like n=1 Tax=Senna tora TaxID=362788 RepID=A0A835CIG6_9FABA|nr:disease resistance protein RML1A-like [Senna tora]
MRRLVSLRFLELKHCISMLKSITEVPYFMSRLDATGCTSLKTFSKRTFMDSLLFINCMGLDEPSLCTIRSSAHFSLMLKAKGPLKEEDDGPITEFCYPGSRVPEWFGSHNQTRQRFITVELAAPPLVDNLMGFVFCAVLPKFTSMEKCPGYMSLRFYCEDVRVRREWRDISREVRRRENEGDNPKISFEFVFDYDCLIKEFGVLPLYAPTQSQ